MPELTPIQYNQLPMGSMANYYMDPQQYGTGYVDTGFMDKPHSGGEIFRSLLQGAASGASFGGPYGALIGAGLSFAGSQLGADLSMNRQRKLYENFMSPQARMRDMVEAGINPNAAAQGISGSGAPSMSAPVSSSASPGLAETLANSENTVLTGQLLRSQKNLNDADAKYTESMDYNQQILNRYVERQQMASLRKLVAEAVISENVAFQISIDSYYKGPNAHAHWLQTCIAVEQAAQQLENTRQEYFNLLAQEYATMQAGNLDKATIRKVFSDIGLNNAQIAEIEHRIENIDMNTMLQAQEISESQVRERLTRAHAQYQERVNNIWRDSDYNFNSEFNANFYGLVSQGKSEKADELLRGMQDYIMSAGKARFNSPDYNMDKAVELISGAMHLFGLTSMASRPTTTTTTNTYNRRGQLIGSEMIKR